MTNTKIWKFLSSVKLAIWLLSIIALLSLIGTFMPQNGEAAGSANIYNSWWFILLLSLFSINLTTCILSRLFAKKSSLGTLICHLSVLVILFGALVGMLYGQKGFIALNKKETVNSFMSGSKHVNLGFAVRLNDFIYSENINPKERLLVYSNAPSLRGGHEVADEAISEGIASPLASLGVRNDSCQLTSKRHEQLIASIPTETGTESKIADTGYKIKVLGYVPDFVMDVSTKKVSTRSMKANNPAIEVELTNNDGAKETFWVFVRYPDIHPVRESRSASVDFSNGVHQSKISQFNFVYNWVGRQPKDFISKVTVIKDNKEILNTDIKVNAPFKFEGFNFFQSSYDPEQLSWSGLRVVKDPGVGIVYSGFGLLILGLSLRFYLNPFMKTLKKI